MKFVVDAQLPKRLARVLVSQGHDAIHTLDLPRRNRTPDEEIVVIAEQEDRIVVTKDADFVNSHVLFGKPEKLLLVSTGNISNSALEALFLSGLMHISASFMTSNFVEISKTAIIVH